MTKKYKILAEYAKDISYETPNIETYLETKENISKYNLNLDIKSKPLKNQIIEVNILIKFKEMDIEKKCSNIEITYATIVKIDKDITDKKEMKKIVLCDIPSEVYPNLEDLFLSLVKKSGFPNVNVEKKVDFYKLFNKEIN